MRRRTLLQMMFAALAALTGAAPRPAAGSISCSPAGHLALDVCGSGKLIIGSTFFAKAGEQVTCEKGHLICTVTSDIRYGEYPSNDQFRDWINAAEPRSGYVPDDCKLCGAIWYRRASVGAATLHFVDRGWG